jgi:hypothetical protein
MRLVQDFSKRKSKDQRNKYKRKVKIELKTTRAKKEEMNDDYPYR